MSIIKYQNISHMHGDSWHTTMQNLVIKNYINLFHGTWQEIIMSTVLVVTYILFKY